jgi:hypothetical protein
VPVGGGGDRGLERRVTTVVGVVRAVTHDNSEVVWRGSGATALTWVGGGRGRRGQSHQRSRGGVQLRADSEQRSSAR